MYLFVDGFGWRVQISVYSVFMPVAFHILLHSHSVRISSQKKRELDFYGFLAYYSNSYFYELNWYKHFFYIYVN